MAQALITTLGRLGLLLGLAGLPSISLAHRLDEYLQATLVMVEPGEVQLQINLTPGVAVADKVLTFIDRDGDGMISPAEAAAYCELLKRNLTVRLDRRKLILELTASRFATPTELRTGWGMIQIEFSAIIDSIKPGTHTLTVKNRHLPALSVYLFNAAQPRFGSVQVTRQKRNEQQSAGEIDFTIGR